MNSRLKLFYCFFFQSTTMSNTKDSDDLRNWRRRANKNTFKIYIYRSCIKLCICNQQQCVTWIKSLSHYQIHISDNKKNGRKNKGKNGKRARMMIRVELSLKWDAGSAFEPSSRQGNSWSRAFSRYCRVGLGGPIFNSFVHPRSNWNCLDLIRYVVWSTSGISTRNNCRHERIDHTVPQDESKVCVAATERICFARKEGR